MDDKHTINWMQRIHRRLLWCCDVDHDEVWFTDGSKFEKHIQSDHPAHADSPSLEIFKERCEVQQSRGSDTCPVCNCTPDGVKIHEELIRHVAEHVKEVGFMSIDYLQDNNEGGEQASSNASGGAQDDQNSLAEGKWIQGEWVPTDKELAAYVDPETLLVPEGPKLLDEEYDWKYVLESPACVQQYGAEQKLRQTLKLASTLIGKKHPDTLTCRSDLATWLEAEERFEEAETEFRCILELRKAILRTSSDTITSMHDLARVLRYLGRDSESYMLATEAERLRREINLQWSTKLSLRIMDLAERVEDEYVGTIAGDEFLPDNKVIGFVTREQVNLAFEDAEIEVREGLVDFVLNGAKRLFLIMVMMTSRRDEKLSLLEDLKAAGVNDASLPIGFDRDKNGYSLEGPPDGSRFSVDAWTRNDRALFSSIQWHFIAPVFDGSKFRFRFHQKRILPFLEMASKPASSGFFGEVSRMEIHPAHMLVSEAVSNNPTSPHSIYTQTS